jgi:hypothetical protein
VSGNSICIAILLKKSGLSSSLITSFVKASQHAPVRPHVFAHCGSLRRCGPSWSARQVGSIARTRREKLESMAAKPEKENATSNDLGMGIILFIEGTASFSYGDKASPTPFPSNSRLVGAKC